jgi:hypothetical protein
VNHPVLNPARAFHFLLNVRSRVPVVERVTTTPLPLELATEVVPNVTFTLQVRCPGLKATSE